VSVEIELIFPTVPLDYYAPRSVAKIFPVVI
jgi:hypothetical protein